MGRGRRDPAIVVLPVLLAGLVIAAWYGARLLHLSPDSFRDTGTPASPTTTGGGPESPGPSSGSPHRATCWNGHAVRTLAGCGLPRGRAGLAWVFPSFASADQVLGQCDDYLATHPDPAYRLLYECFGTVAGQSVTVTYARVVDVTAASAVFDGDYPVDRRGVLGGPDGGRLIWRDDNAAPARVTVMYAHSPYAVSVYAPDSTLTQAALRQQVRMRSPDRVRGAP